MSRVFLILVCNQGHHHWVGVLQEFGFYHVRGWRFAFLAVRYIASGLLFIYGGPPGS